MGLRRKARELALQFLFSDDFGRDLDSADQLAAALERFAVHFNAGRKALPYAWQLVQGIREKQQAIDGLIAAHSHNWRLERMSPVDRNILRIAAFEMAHCEDVPARVAINEALEIAKRYSTEDAVPFINGILDGVQGGLRHEAHAGGAGPGATNPDT